MTDPAGTYFTAACPPLQNLLDRTCEGIAAAADDASRAGLPVGTIVLGGGYGRGEGGVWTGRDGKAEVHNDLDFFLFSDQPDHELLRAWVAEQERHWSARLGIHVDFACLPPQSLDRARESMMLTDLVLGYRAVFGGVDFLEVAARDVDPSRLPLWEASRLLWNRGSGLFFARCRLQEWCEWDFIERNQQKLALALGDALLCLAGKYHPMVAERYRRVVELPIEHFGVADGERLRSLHREAVEYKLRPAPVEQDRARWRQRDEELTRLWADVFLKVESARTGRDFANLAEYIADRRRLVPESPLWRNFLISVRDRRNHGKRLSPAWEYPRATVMRCLAAIHSDDATSAAALLGEAPVDSCRQLESVYTDWWNRYQ